MTDSPLARGAWPVVLTPFQEDRQIDWPAYRALIDFYLDHGAAGLFASCLSSEIQELTADEIVELARVAVQHTAGRASVVAGAVLDAPVAEIADLARRVADTGAAAVVVAAGTLVPPGADEAAWRDAFEVLMQRTPGIDLGIYECPWPHHRVLSAATLGWLAQTGRVVFHKDTACNLEAIHAKLDAIAGHGLAFYNAHGPTLKASLDRGAAGYCGTGANFAPELFAAACRPDADPEVWHRLAELEPLVPPGYPANAKATLAHRGVPMTPVCRIPARPDPHNLQLHKEFIDALASSNLCASAVASQP